MLVGGPGEITPDEYRVSVVPQTVAEALGLPFTPAGDIPGLGLCTSEGGE